MNNSILKLFEKSITRDENRQKTTHHWKRKEIKKCLATVRETIKNQLKISTIIRSQFYLRKTITHLKK